MFQFSNDRLKHVEYNEIDETKREYLIPKSFATADLLGYWRCEMAMIS